ncbi:MAG: hypothetical protein BA865_06005 [Desulfobacterales bacterium S5133MH4]|nr:MAG: hypothetical protein BA865_06005 [Desulfobacterales bacterium S5133MH4]
MKVKISVITTVIFVLFTGNTWADSKGRTTILKRLDVGSAYTPKVLGLFIGIQEYTDPFWHDLKYPEKDVRDMVGFFTKNTAIELDYKIVLTKPEETTRDIILNHKLDEFEMKNSSDKDIVIVYISSHGTLTREVVTIIENGKKRKQPRKIPYVLTSDSQEGKVEDTALPLYKIVEWFEKLRSQRKVLILDMCHSGRYGKSQVSPDQAELIESAKGINYMPVEDSWASIILSACPMGGTSFEDSDLKNSVYTHFLLEGMSLGDLNGDGSVSISEAHNHSIDKTRQYTWERRKYKQVPTTYSRILGKDPIIVFGTPANTGASTLFSYSSANHGVELYLDGIHNGMLPKGIVVEPGTHKVECRRNGCTIYSEKIKVNPGHDYMLPCLDGSDHYNEDKVLAIIEVGYRDFSRGQVSEDLTPGDLTTGFSLHYYGFNTKWIDLSCGFDFARNQDLEQYSYRLGAKFTTALGDARFFAGPDLMFMFFRYTSNTIGGKKVDSEMSFFCPGAEALLTYNVKQGLCIALGARVHYLPYSLNSETKNMISGQAFLSAGYSF